MRVLFRSRSSVGLVPGKGGNQGRHHVFDVGFELLARRTRLLQLQLQLQETDVGRVRQARAVLGIAAAKAGLAEGGGQVFEPTLGDRSEEHTSELQSLMRISYAVFCLKTKKTIITNKTLQ